MGLRTICSRRGNCTFTGLTFTDSEARITKAAHSTKAVIQAAHLLGSERRISPLYSVERRTCTDFHWYCVLLIVSGNLHGVCVHFSKRRVACFTMWPLARPRKRKWMPWCGGETKCSLMSHYLHGFYVFLLTPGLSKLVSYPCRWSWSASVRLMARRTSETSCALYITACICSLTVLGMLNNIKFAFHRPQACCCTFVARAGCLCFVFRLFCSPPLDDGLINAHVIHYFSFTAFCPNHLYAGVSVFYVTQIAFCRRGDPLSNTPLSHYRVRLDHPTISRAT